MEADINLQTKIAALLESYPELEDKLIELSPVFAKLRNPVLRKTVAKVTSIQQAAAIAGISAPLLVIELRKAAGFTVSESNLNQSDHVGIEPQPSWFDKNNISLYYDARPVIDAGRSPMQEILNLASKLEGGEILHFTTPFKPMPILDILKAKGFEVWSDDENNYIINLKS
ncbi:DUF1858 domain-containing protein [Dysgonomonas sp.]